MQSSAAMSGSAWAPTAGTCPLPWALSISTVQGHLGSSLDFNCPHLLHLVQRRTQCFPGFGTGFGKTSSLFPSCRHDTDTLDGRVVLEWPDAPCKRAAGETGLCCGFGLREAPYHAPFVFVFESEMETLHTASCPVPGSSGNLDLQGDF